MIFTDLQKDIASVPNGDAYFTAPLASGRARCTALWQGQQEDALKGSLETAKAAQAALNREGVTCIVTEPEITVSENIFAVASVSLFFCENVFQNRGADGSKNTAYEFATKALALLLNQCSGVWGPLMFDGLTAAEVSKEGYIAWELTFRTQTMLDVLFTAIANEFGQIITDAAGHPIRVTPTPA